MSFPKYISGAVSRTVDKYAKEYVKLAEAFTRSDWGAVRGFIGAKEFKDVSLEVRTVLSQIKLIM